MNAVPPCIWMRSPGRPMTRFIMTGGAAVPWLSATAEDRNAMTSPRRGSSPGLYARLLPMTCTPGWRVGSIDAVSTRYGSPRVARAAKATPTASATAAGTDAISSHWRNRDGALRAAGTARASERSPGRWARQYWARSEKRTKRPAPATSGNDCPACTRANKGGASAGEGKGIRNRTVTMASRAGITATQSARSARRTARKADRPVTWLGELLTGVIGGWWGPAGREGLYEGIDVGENGKPRVDGPPGGPAVDVVARPAGRSASGDIHCKRRTRGEPRLREEGGDARGPVIEDAPRKQIRGIERRHLGRFERVLVAGSEARAVGNRVDEIEHITAHLLAYRRRRPVGLDDTDRRRIVEAAEPHPHLRIPVLRKEECQVVERSCPVLARLEFEPALRPVPCGDAAGSRTLQDLGANGLGRGEHIPGDGRLRQRALDAKDARVADDRENR